MIPMLTYKNFSKALNSKFITGLDDGRQVELKLESISELKVTPQQEMFSIFFRGPNDAFLDQGSRPLRHEAMGLIELFLVPIAQTAEGYQYESVFNRLRKPDDEPGTKY